MNINIQNQAIVANPKTFNSKKFKLMVHYNRENKLVLFVIIPC